MFEALGEVIGNAFRSIVDAIGKVFTVRPEHVKAINAEIAGPAFSEDLFDAPEIKLFVHDLKETASHSPESILETLVEGYFKLIKTLYDSMIGILIPVKIKDFESAKTEAGHLTALATGFVLLTALLDTISTASSGTLVRNVVHIGRMFIATFGLDEYSRAVIAPAVGASVVPHLTYGFNEQFQAQIPPIQDVIRFTVREVYDPERRRELLSVPTPPEAYKFAKKHGYSPDIMDDYWAAHWVLPSAGELNTMLHRGVIDAKTWERYMRLNDYEPGMIDKYRAITYIPYARVDVRRMYDMKILDRDQVKRTYLDMGYDEEHAENLTKFVEELNKKQTDKTKVEGRDLTKAEIVKAFRIGNISHDEAKARLMDLDYDELEAEFILALEKHQETVKRRELSQKRLDLFYKYGVISEDEYRRRLIDLGYSPQAVNEIVEYMQTEAALEVKRLPLGTLREALRKKVISQQEFAERMRYLQYPDADVAVILALETQVPEAVPAKKEERRDLAASTYQRLFIENVIESEDQLRKYLSELKPPLPSDRIELLVKDAKMRKEKKAKPTEVEVPSEKTRSLAASTFQRLFIEDVIESEDQLYEYLSALKPPYPEDQLILLMEDAILRKSKEAKAK
jgi:hypothetical protein